MPVGRKFVIKILYRVFLYSCILLSWRAYENVKRFEMLASDCQYPASKVGGAILILIPQLTRTLSYSCHIHCRLLSYARACPRCPQTTAESLSVRYVRLTAICRDMAASFMTSLRVFSTTLRQCASFCEFSSSLVRVPARSPKSPMGMASLSSIQFQHKITQDAFHQQYISELIIRSTCCWYTLTYRIIIASKKRMKVRLCVKGLHTYQRNLNSILLGEIIMKYKICVMSCKVERVSYYIVVSRTNAVLMSQYIVAYRNNTYLIVQNSYKPVVMSKNYRRIIVQVSKKRVQNRTSLM